jgi:hypothetical protein
MHMFQSKFVKRWNSGRLERMYYEGIPENVVETTKRTRHAWGFVKHLNDRERMDLASTKDSVGVDTRKPTLLAHETARRVESGAALPDERRSGRDAGHPREPEHERRSHHRVGDKRARRDHDAVLEELVPRETGREVLLEKRRQLGDRIHGAARDRDANRDGLDVSDEFLMGGGDHEKDDLNKRLQQRAQVRHRRDHERQERVAAAEAKEAAKMDKFLQDMGLANDAASRRPITIQPRRDA